MFPSACESDKERDVLSTEAFYPVIDFQNKMKYKNRRLLCWRIVLQEYDLDVRHIKVVCNVCTDALSLSLKK